MSLLFCSDMLILFRVVFCFCSSVFYSRYSIYLASNLSVELSNIFLHQRKLLLLSDLPLAIKDPISKLNTAWLIASFIPTRFIGNGYLMWRVYMDYAYFASFGVWQWTIAFLGMIALNILNVVLFRQLMNAESKIGSKGKHD